MTWSTFQSLKIFDLQSPLRNYIDQLEQPGGKQYNIQNFMMMYIFGSTTNTEYRTKLFDHWPTVAFLKKKFCLFVSSDRSATTSLGCANKIFCSVPGGLQWVQGNHGIPLSWDAGGGVPVARGDGQEHQDLGPRLRTRQRGFYCKNIFLGREFTGINSFFFSCAMSTVSQILTGLTPVPGFWQQLKKKVKLQFFQRIIKFLSLNGNVDLVPKCECNKV